MSGSVRNCVGGHGDVRQLLLLEDPCGLAEEDLVVEEVRVGHVAEGACAIWSAHLDVLDLERVHERRLELGDAHACGSS